MKKIFISASLLLSLSLTFSGCKKELEEKYNNPEKSTQASLPGFFTGILNNDRVRPSYWNVRTFLLQQPAIYSQTAFFTNGNSVYQQSDSYSSQYWSDFYAPSGNGSGVVGMYRAMEVAYAQLSDADKASQEIFIQAARVVLYDQTSQMVDLWGDIPFSEAASLQQNSTIANPKFDAQAELYNNCIAGLQTAAAYFKSASTNPSFNKADILLRGNLKRWEAYANSIRLRLLMRISNVSESTSQSQVMAMLSNSDEFPLVDGGNAANYNPGTSDILLMPLITNTNSLRDALTELPSHNAPDYMLNKVMLPANDPRIPVMFDKFGRTVSSKFVPNKAFRAMPITYTSTQQADSAASFAILDSTTFQQNPNLPGIVITASEVNFLKAEAQERWGTSTAAEEAYETAVKQSVTFYYYLNSLNSTGLKKEDKPTDAVIDTFVSDPDSPIAYTGSVQEKLANIWTQKWLHFGFLQSTQAWSEYRRTNYPQLTFPEATLSGYETPPTRLLYPSTEKSLNSANYQAVQPKDTRTAKIFWDVN
jgi:hypothetical protein